MKSQPPETFRLYRNFLLLSVACRLGLSERYCLFGASLSRPVVCLLLIS